MVRLIIVLLLEVKPPVPAIILFIIFYLRLVEDIVEVVDVFEGHY